MTQNKNETKQTSMANEATRDFDKIVSELIEYCVKITILTSIGVGDFFKLLLRHYILMPLIFGSLFTYLYYQIQQGEHLYYLHLMLPHFKQKYDLFEWFYKFDIMVHCAVIYSLIILVVSLPLGIISRHIRDKFETFFLTVGLTNGLDNTPKLIYKRKLDKFRTQYEFDANGIGLKEFEAITERVEAMFKTPVESIEHGKNRGRILITLNSKTFPSRISYKEVIKEKRLPADSFYVGYAMKGIVTQKIASLPHMLIAGATGTGKSTFFKQALVGLLESTPHLQMYLIDLKGGLEMIDFAKTRNVKVIKTMSEAVTILRQVEKEMMNRFNFLEAKGLKQISPKRDKKDRIILAVDEASILYMSRNKKDVDYKYAIEARQLADNIAKLSRAAGIHLLLATQKVEKAVIPTSITENISGRVAFRSNSFAGSANVLGNKASSDLPDIAGRGIWSLGSNNVLFQAPLMSTKEINDRCENVENEFLSNRRWLFEKMIGEQLKEKTDQQKNDFYNNEEEE